MIEETDWFKLSKAERSRHLKKVMGTAITLESPELSLSSTVLSMDAETASEFVSIPLPVLDGIWVKASSLVAHQDNISSAPGYPHGCKMVKSYSGKRPHLVTSGKNGHFKCDDDCLNFKSVGLCSHTVAVAQQNNSLEKFLTVLGKSKRRPNFTKVALHNMPLGCGKKGAS